MFVFEKNAGNLEPSYKLRNLSLAWSRIIIIIITTTIIIILLLIIIKIFSHLRFTIRFRPIIMLHNCFIESSGRNQQLTKKIEIAFNSR